MTDRTLTVRRFWEQAREIQISLLPGVLAHQQWRVATNHLDDRQLAQQLRFIGAVTTRKVEDFFHPASYAIRERLNRNGRRSPRRGSGAGRSSLFRGHDWQQVTVIPFENSPGNICGFALLDGDEGQSTDEWWQYATNGLPPWSPGSVRTAFGPWAAEDAILFKTVGRSRRRPAEAGLAMLTVALHRPPDEVANQLFVFVDLVLALRLQLRWLQSSIQPLPVVAARDDVRSRTVTTWQNLSDDERKTVVAPAAEPRVFRQAQLAQANVYLDPSFTQKVIAGFTSPLVLLRRAQRRSKPWDDALRYHLKRLTPDRAAEFLNQIQLPAQAWVDFLNQSDRGLIDHLRRSSQSQDFGPRACARSEVVIEREDGWFLRRTSGRVCDPVRIDEILRRHDGTDFLRGHVTRNGIQHHFTIPQRRAELLGLQQCLREAFRKDELIFRWRRGWSREILALAIEMCQPKTIQDADLVGWRQRIFSFPRFGLDTQGFRAELCTPLVNDQTPARNLDPPEPLEKRRVRELTWDAAAANRFWAVILCMARNILAPAVGKPPMGVLLLAAEAGRLATAISDTFGCRALVSPKRSDAWRQYQHVNTILEHSRWPLVLRSSVTTSGAIGHLLRQVTPCNCFVTATAIEYPPAGLPQGWWILDVTNADGTIELLARFGAQVLLNYLRYVRRRHLELLLPKRKHRDPVWHDLAYWFGELGRGRPAVLGADRYLRVPAQSVDSCTHRSFHDRHESIPKFHPWPLVGSDCDEPDGLSVSIENAVALA